MKELVDYFISETNGKFKSIEAKIDELHGDVRGLDKFKYKILGGGFVMSIIIPIIVTMLIR